MIQHQGVPQSSPQPALPRKRRRFWVLLTLGILLPLLCIALFGSSLAFFHTYRVDGQAMQPALAAGEQIIVNKSAYLFSGPSRGDVITFYYPLDPTQVFIKRVIAIPGDTVKVTLNQVWVDGVLLHEPYITQPMNPSVLTLTLKPNEYFVMGDNRPYSSDSRNWGPVPSTYIIGKAVYAAGSQGFRSISTYPDVFSSLK